MTTQDGTKNNVVNLLDYKRKKEQLTREFRDSLDNNKVMQSYKINKPTPEERQERIKESIKRVNALMEQLKERK